jgi:phosphatidylglycerophosphate synthase
VKADLYNSLFALLVVLVMTATIFLGERYAVPAVLISTALALSVSGARAWVVRRGKRVETRA